MPSKFNRIPIQKNSHSIRLLTKLCTFFVQIVNFRDHLGVSSPAHSGRGRRSRVPPGSEGEAFAGRQVLEDRRVQSHQGVRPLHK